MAFQYYSSSSASANNSVSLYDKEKFNRYVEERGKINAAGFKALGVQIINFNEYTPPDGASTVFQCTADLRGRLYPSPATQGLFVLDFINSTDERFIGNTKLAIYDIGPFGDNARRKIEPQGSCPDRQGTVDLYILNPRRLVEIVEDTGQTLKRISFYYINGLSIVPVVINM